jgi:Skp family chaperone for outer membrane proteins
MLSMDAKEDRQKELQKKNRDLNYLVQDMSDEYKKAENDARTDILQVLMKVVDTIAKRDKFDLINEKIGSGVLYVTPALDITDDVIKEMNNLKP